MFDWENAIALHAMQGNRASSRCEGEVSWVFSSRGRNLPPYRVEMRADSLSSKEEVSHLSTSTSRGVFP